MTIENCELLKKAKALAIEKGLDPAEVVCDSCPGETDCPYGDSEPLTEKDENLSEKRITEEINKDFFTNLTMIELGGIASH